MASRFGRGWAYAFVVIYIKSTCFSSRATSPPPSRLNNCSSSPTDGLPQENLSRFFKGKSKSESNKLDDPAPRIAVNASPKAGHVVPATNIESGPSAWQVIWRSSVMSVASVAVPTLTFHMQLSALPSTTLAFGSLPDVAARSLPIQGYLASVGSRGFDHKGVLVDVDPDARPEWSEVKQHPYFKDLDWDRVAARGYDPHYRPCDRNRQHHPLVPTDNWISEDSRGSPSRDCRRYSTLQLGKTSDSALLNIRSSRVCPCKMRYMGSLACPALGLVRVIRANVALGCGVRRCITASGKSCFAHAFFALVDHGIPVDGWLNAIDECFTVLIGYSNVLITFTILE
ncbi:hypothetical protein PAXINDRAFT_13127 [Paxillus involutus ATCC 200175]|uniref:Uncharacterized protein n=1 Tax=Paxillus involutus ATCC 200175 TaxID=664439 RepID=A0A0C9TEI3_PAXIN|nr:hypothetical protein PAXINDRAFT_13127 [Paxillus involutus ATCC 200175]